jgi:hypothetical protein
VSESSYDWGQGLKERAGWQHQHRAIPGAVRYDGTDPALRRILLRRVPLHALVIGRPEDVIAQAPGHSLAVSASAHGVTLTEPRGGLEGSPARQPVARTTTFFIDDFPREKQPGPRAGNPARG